MTANNEYHLKTIEDIVKKIPTDRLDVFLEEFKEYIKTAKNVVEMIKAAGEEVAESAINHFSFGYEMVWKDDNKKDIGIRVSIDTRKKEESNEPSKSDQERCSGTEEAL